MIMTIHGIPPDRATGVYVFDPDRCFLAKNS
jgi:hypothetical protein